MTNTFNTQSWLPEFRPNKEISPKTVREAKAILADLKDLTPEGEHYASLVPVQGCPWDEGDFASAAREARKMVDDLEAVVNLLNKLATIYENRPYE